MQVVVKHDLKRQPVHEIWAPKDAEFFYEHRVLYSRGKLDVENTNHIIVVARVGESFPSAKVSKVLGTSVTGGSVFVLVHLVSPNVKELGEFTAREAERIGANKKKAAEQKAKQVEALGDGDEEDDFDEDEEDPDDE
jgi:hypothetical protein